MYAFGDARALRGTPQRASRSPYRLERRSTAESVPSQLAE